MYVHTYLRCTKSNAKVVLISRGLQPFKPRERPDVGSDANQITGERKKKKMPVISYSHLKPL